MKRYVAEIIAIILLLGTASYINIPGFGLGFFLLFIVCTWAVWRGLNLHQHRSR